jgi:1,4-alpha-glucan branching enzyme
MDLKTETEEVAKVFKDWVPGYVQKYGIDGFRVDDECATRPT